MVLKKVGTWWSERNIDLVEIEGEVYALYGWNGESYLESWKCTGEDYMEASEEQYEVIPIYGDDLTVIRYEARKK